MKLSETERLLEVVHQLRRKCPWDRKQTHKSLMPYLLEEAYETLDAIERGGPDEFREELGDLLLQIVLHSEITKEKGKFAFEDVARGIADKMVRRHPHVFERGKAGSAKEHSKNWTKLKSKEKPKRGLLEGIPRALPALALAQRYGEIAASVSFDWESAEQVLGKVEEELEELRREIRRKNRRATEMEMGDLLFTLAQLSRHLKLSAETALRKSAAKFEARFAKLEKSVEKSGKRLAELSMKELDQHWNRIKKK